MQPHGQYHRADALVTGIHQVNGFHPGYRAVHALGRIYRGSFAASGDGVGAPPVVQPRHVIRVRVREEEGGHGRAARRARPPAVDGDERVARHRDEDGAHRFVRLGFESSFPVSSSSLALSGSSLSPFVLARGPDAASDDSHEGEREGRKEEKRGVSRRRSLFSRCHPKEEKK